MIEKLGVPKEDILESRTTLRLGPYTALDTISKQKYDGVNLQRSAAKAGLSKRAGAD